MFERDKDDLRTLGIRIDVGSFDPLFSDESGYRIRSENYQLDLGAITPTELALLSLAAEAWQGAAMEDAAQSAILKLKSIGVAADTLDIPAVPLKMSNSSKDLNTITEAIAVSNLLAFDYLSANMDIQQRVVVPFALSNKNGFWYLTGVEQEILEIRTFRLDRIQGAIQQRGNREAFEFPEDFDISKSLNVSSHETAIIDVRKGRGFSLRALATSTKDLGEWDQLVVPIFNLENLASQVLWHGLDAHVQEPTHLKQHMVKQLRALVANHG
jgi:proteasome accessory factor B